MAVYVDGASHKYGRMVMCHMLADSLPELLEMADTIGVARCHYQSFAKASCPHFDIARSKRALAIKAGAIWLHRAQLGKTIRRIKQDALAKIAAGEPHGWEEPARPGFPH